ncbi:MAG: hypothetical protein JWN39_3931 [Ilumatobacteraceae bacterium]|nr:hypothetical protein [Ilumatobacteraceae bacterium]
MAARRRPSYLSPLALARRNGLYKGVIGGDRKWLVIGGVVWGARFLRKAAGKSEQIVTIEKLEPGQWMSLRTISAKEQKQEQQAAKLSRKSHKAAQKRSGRKRSVGTS